MPSVKSSITIRRSPEHVFAVLTDVELTSRWFPWKVEEHWTSPPPHGVGSTRHALVRMYGRRSENDAVTTEYDPPHRAAMRGTSPNARFLAELDFAAADGGTRVDVTSSFDLQGLERVFGPLVLWFYGRMWGRGLANLKRMMESGQL